MHMNIDEFAPPTEDNGFAIAQYKKKFKDGKGGPEIKIPPSSDSVELASKTLFELWGTPLADYELNPPITPVTNQVLHLNSKI
ncbi:uncharacterized protein LOC6602287 [Drosophila persimilis]|uniref:uncharacterized protein LOC6602287 n=1 Tax=Drosophila persimilis TaxID=7234 RepID=UPI000F0978CA|nr:uncharacterized protein LOC6602287 [Drosophila persimilis]XP_026848558.1 uncharacterized protein LOC6602287 [Drosophila persimilis]